MRLSVAWITRAAVPAVSGAASLVRRQLDRGALPRSWCSRRTWRVRGAQGPVQVARRDDVDGRAFCAKPPELRPLMLLSSQP